MKSREHLKNCVQLKSVFMKCNRYSLVKNADLHTPKCGKVCNTVHGGFKRVCQWLVKMGHFSH